MRWHVIAVALAVLAALGVLGALPRARAMWRRWLSDLRATLGGVKNDEQRAARWKQTIRAIGLLAVAVLLLSLLLPRLRVVAILLAVFGVVAMLSVLPRLRAMNWRHWQRLGRDVGAAPVQPGFVINHAAMAGKHRVPRSAVSRKPDGRRARPSGLIKTVFQTESHEYW
jgi:hypothetical protein